MKCDICKEVEATKDSKTIWGPWAYLCETCFEKYGDKTEGLSSNLEDIK